MSEYWIWSSVLLLVFVQHGKVDGGVATCPEIKFILNLRITIRRPEKSNRTTAVMERLKICRI